MTYPENGTVERHELDGQAHSIKANLIFRLGEMLRFCGADCCPPTRQDTDAGRSIVLALQEAYTLMRVILTTCQMQRPPLDQAILRSLQRALLVRS